VVSAHSTCDFSRQIRSTSLIKFSISIELTSQPFLNFLRSSLLSAIGSHGNSPKLPIHGDVEDEITLGLNFPEGSDNNLFKLNGKLLQLVHPLDRDKENLSHIQFTVSLKPQRERDIESSK
jgi:hypothetical protein